MKMDYYILEQAYAEGEANGKKEYEKTINDFLYALLLKRDADEAKKYITKADSRILDSHENKDEGYEEMLTAVDTTIEQLNMIKEPVVDTGYTISKASQATANGVDITVVRATYFVDIGSEKPSRNLNIYMQKENGKWKIYDAR